MKANTKNPPARAKSSTRKAVDPAALMAKIPEKVRETFERQADACENKLPPEVRQRWHDLTRMMMGVAQALPKASGSNTMMFFIPDGQYRKQVFAIHARKDGTLLVCTTDIVDQAVRAGILTKPGRTEVKNLYRIGPTESLTIDAYDGKTPDPEPFIKDMTGWNRRAMCITISPSATQEQVEAVVALCMLSAEPWLEKI